MKILVILTLVVIPLAWLVRQFYRMAKDIKTGWSEIDQRKPTNPKPLPPEPTAAELEAKAEQQAKEKKREALQRKVQLAESFVEQEQQAAQQQAIDELVAKRSAEVLAASPKALYVQKAQENRAKFEADLQALAELGDT